MTILMVAEKPLLAESIANYLAIDQVRTRNGISPVCKVHEFTCIFKGQKRKAKMTSVAGHVYTCEFEKSFQNWSVDPKDLFNCRIEKHEANPKTKIPQHLRNEAKGCNTLVLWLDCDREGENICFEVMDNTVRYMNQNCLIYRAIFSSITKKDIEKAFKNLENPNDKLALAVDCRQEIDLRVGVAFTRLQTKFLREKFPKMQDLMISFGPCQTPTLGFCIERYREIENFESTPYYLIHVDIEDDDGNLKTFKLDQHFSNRNDAEQVIKACKSVQGKILKVEVNEKIGRRPGGLNTVELLKNASKKLGIGPQETMHVAEKLYTRGYISYPRTESTKYSNNFNFDDILINLKTSDDFKRKIEIIQKNGVNMPRFGEDKGDHPPITPLKYPREELKPLEKKLFDYIANIFLGSIYKDAVYQQVSVTIGFDKYKFTSTSRSLKDPGFNLFTNKYIDQYQDENTLKGESFKEGNNVKRPAFDIIRKMTECPDYLSEHELIAMMEKNGIGTDASIPVHIQNIITREYVKLDESKRTLKPTKMGMALVKTLEEVDKDLTQPRVRAHIEEMVTKIAEGKADIEDVLDEALDKFESIFETYRKKLQILEDNFAPMFKVQEQLKLFSKCGDCGRMLVKVSGEKMLLRCDQCSKSLTLPQNATYTQQTKCCPICNFEMIMMTTKGSDKKEMVCPKCFNFKNSYMDNSESSCLNCKNPNCKMSMESTKVLPCSVCGGTFCLSALQNKYTCFCNKCDSTINWNATVKKVIIKSDLCGKCKYHLVDIEMKDGKKLDGCLGCNANVKILYQLKAVKPVVQVSRGNHGNRGNYGNRGGHHHSNRGGFNNNKRGNNFRGRGGKK